VRYQLTALTPLLVGDGQKLSPIDYMVWKDQVNVLDQRRIFKLLAKGPRLEGYLSQLRKAEKLDFASWGGFAQNFAGRRIPFEHASSTKFWEQARAESLHIPTFSSGPSGAFLPASAIKGALRTGVTFTRWNAGVLKQIGSRIAERGLRRPGEAAEAMTLGATGGGDPMRLARAGDSDPISSTVFRVYLVRVSTLEQHSGKLELGWKTAPRGSVSGDRADSATPSFAEMAVPGTSFSGDWSWNAYLQNPEIAKILHRKENGDGIFAAANAYAEKLLETQHKYSVTAGISALTAGIDLLRTRLTEVRTRPNACLLNLGWGGGFLGKVAFFETEAAEYRDILKELPYYARAVRPGLPFPKTRHIVFVENRPAVFPGWAVLEIANA
jgi:CRISPR-associated protein Csm5